MIYYFITQFLPVILLSLLFFAIKFYSIEKQKIFRKFSEDLANEFTMIKAIKEGGYKIPRKYDNYYFSDSLYPVFFQLLCSFLPNRIILSKSHWIIIFVDYLHVIFLFFVCQFIYPNIIFNTLFTILFIVCPLWMFWPNRSFSFSSRAPGSLLYSLTIFSFFFYLFGGYNEFFVLIPILLISLTLLTHRFATQVLFFTTVILSILYQFEFILFYITGTVISIIISRGHYVNVIKGHFGAFYFFKIFDERYSDVSGPTEIQKLARFFTNPFKRKNISDSLIIYLKWNPILFLLFLILFDFVVLDHYSNLDGAFLFLIICSSILPLLTILTSFKSTRFLGQPERYLEYGLFPSSLLGSYFFSSNYFNLDLSDLSSLKYGLSLFLIFAISLRFFYVKFSETQSWWGKDYNWPSEIDQIYQGKVSDYNSLFEFLDKLDEGLILSIKISFSHHIALKSKHKVLYNMAAQTIETSKELSKIILKFPVPNLDYIFENYNVDYIVVEKDFCENAHLKGVSVDMSKLSKYQRLFDNDHYSVIKYE